MLRRRLRLGVRHAFLGLGLPLGFGVGKRLRLLGAAPARRIGEALLDLGLPLGLGVGEKLLLRGIPFGFGLFEAAVERRLPLGLGVDEILLVLRLPFRFALGELLLVFRLPFGLGVGETFVGIGPPRLLHVGEAPRVSAFVFPSGLRAALSVFGLQCGFRLGHALFVFGLPFGLGKGKAALERGLPFGLGLGEALLVLLPPLGFGIHEGARGHGVLTRPHVGLEIFVFRRPLGLDFCETLFLVRLPFGLRLGEQLFGLGLPPGLEVGRGLLILRRRLGLVLARRLRVGFLLRLRARVVVCRAPLRCCRALPARRGRGHGYVEAPQGRGGIRAIGLDAQDADHQFVVASASRRRRETQAVDLVGPQRPRLVAVVGAGGELGANGHAFELDDEFLGRADFGQPEADAERHGTVLGGRRGRDIDDRRVVDDFERHEGLVARLLFRGGGLFLGHQLDSHLRSPDRILAWPPATTPFFSGPFFAGPILVTRAW